MSRRNEPWPVEREAILKRLIADDYTSGEAAKELCVTRNAVIGKARRMKEDNPDQSADWQWKGHPYKRGMSREGTPKPPKPPKPHIYPKNRHRPASPEREATLQNIFRQASEKTDIAAEMITGGVTILDLEYHHCRWPLSGHAHEVPPEKFLYCGAKRIWHRGELCPYCAEHHEQSIQGQQQRKVA